MILNNVMKYRIPSNKAYKLLARFYDKSTNNDVLQKYKALIGPVKEQYILDLGCGTGTLLKYYASQNRTYGIDGSPDMLKIAKIKDKKTHYSVGDLRNVKIDNKFNIITCAFDTINHLTSIGGWEKLFETVAKNLR